jgi:hypothetical protein
MTSQIGWNLVENDISLIHEISDDMAFRIITSISDSAKAATRISIENNIPLSSTYKKIKKLQKFGVVRIYRSEMDGSGKKVLLYRSNIASFEFKIERAVPHLV